MYITLNNMGGYTAIFAAITILVNDKMNDKTEKRILEKINEQSQQKTAKSLMLDILKSAGKFSSFGFGFGS